MVASDSLWEVTGGTGRGGVIVRAEKELSSPQEPARLATGARVRALEHDAALGRLRFERLSGAGPASGWVSTQAHGKPLLVRTAETCRSGCAQTGTEEESKGQDQGCAPEKAASNKQVLKWYSENFIRRGDAPKPSHEEVDSTSTQWSLVGSIGQAQDQHMNHNWETSWYADFPCDPSEVLQPVAQQYCARGDGRRSEHNPMSSPLFVTAPDTRQLLRNDIPVAPMERQAPPPPRPAGALQLAAAHLQPRTSAATAPQDSEAGGHPARAFGYGSASDRLAPADGLSIKRAAALLQAKGVCPACRLPLGELGYAADGHEGAFMHGECKAQALLRYAREAEQLRVQKDASSKRDRRLQYGIGWNVSRIPRSLSVAAKFGYDVGGAKLCCLVLHEGTRSVVVAPTLDPAAAVNLEYLSLALRVRLQEGREPVFSLDPIELDHSSRLHEEKKSAWQVKRFEPAWLAGTSVGEVMFQADYHLKELSMGECEQPVVGMRSCFDYSEAEGHDKEWNAREWFVVRQAEIQLSSDHVLIPRVKMGVEAREQVRGLDGLEDAPITRPDHPLVRYAEAFSKHFDIIAERKSVIYHLRELAKAAALAKFLVEAEVNLDESWAGAVASGGGQPGCLEIPQLWNERHHSQIQVSDGRIKDWDAGIGSRVHGVYGGVQMGLERFPLQEVVVAPPRISRADLAAKEPAGVAVSRAFVQGLAAGLPQGVDLSLDGFNLSAPLRRPEDSGPHGGFPLGSAFWSALDERERPAGGGRAEVLAELFNPHLSDRRGEGETFVPPESSAGYLNKLCGVLQEEKQLMQARTDCFLGKEFSLDNAGPLFPSSWTAAIEVRRGQAPRPDAQHYGRGLREVPLAAAPKFDRVLRSSVPEFDKQSENGCRFRIYRAGIYEVRTIQESGGREVIGAVYSRGAAGPSSVPCDPANALDDEFVSKASEFVEAVVMGGGNLEPSARATSCGHRLYVVMETHAGNHVVIERAHDGQVKWAHNTAELETRNLSAKVMRCRDFQSGRISVSLVKDALALQKHGMSSSASPQEARDGEDTAEVYDQLLALAAMQA